MEPTVEIVSVEEMEEMKAQRNAVRTDVGMMIEVILKTNWTEWWIVALMMFHLLTFITILVFRRSTSVQTCLLTGLGILCLLSENINELAANNWRKFASQQYFDSTGLFLSVIFSIPLLLNCLLILLCLFYVSCITMQMAAKTKLKMQKQNSQVQKSQDEKKKD